MELSKAQDILAHIVGNRVRWGKMYDASDIGLEKLTEALIALSQGDVSEAADLRASLANANRQLGAAKSREAKTKKQIEALKAEIAGLDAVIDKIHEGGSGKEE